MATIEIKIPNRIPIAMRKKFLHLREMSDKEICTKLVTDELGDFSIFDPEYYNLEDIKQIFFQK